MADEATPVVTEGESPKKAVKDDDVVDAMNHLVQGKRHLLVQDIPSAVESLGEASQLLAKKFGETSNECGDAFLLYGTALLEMSREESAVLGIPEGGDASAEDSDKESDKSDDDEEENGSSDGEEAKSPDSESLEEDEFKEKTPAGGDEGDKKEEKQAKDDGKKNGVTEPSAKPEVPSSSSGPSSSSSAAPAGTTGSAAGPSSSSGAADGASSSGNGEEKEEDVSNLQLAWEMLELAKVIFERQAADSNQMKLKLAEVHMRLGEVGMESENYEQSANDLFKCLEIRRNVLDHDDRLITEVHYQLGLSFSFNYQYDEAMQHFTEASELIELRISNLTQKIEAQNSDLTADELEAHRREVSDLQDILPDIKEKIKDTVDMKKEALNPEIKNIGASMSSKSEDTPVVPTSTIAVKKAPQATSIGHLVKRKRTPGEDSVTVPDQAEAKKLKPESPAGQNSAVSSSHSVIQHTSQVDGLGQSKSASFEPADSSERKGDGSSSEVTLTSFKENNHKETSEDNVSSTQTNSKSQH